MLYLFKHENGMIWAKCKESAFQPREKQREFTNLEIYMHNFIKVKIFLFLSLHQSKECSQLYNYIIDEIGSKINCQNEIKSIYIIVYEITYNEIIRVYELKRLQNFGKLS